ncbi:nuclease-related domain-containing protein [Staphylococcus debuckii]|uniref:nuclease-related domain-containing protein n=1 Tax=Staphylococcus debuckii TaxID=2044912 RepID=UPI000F438D50|nr:nuclease-related domain-containing protein [Staphylococcus debuckii]AYU54420.1 NERD domain-containing protein [Staphylococcus debuckii]
MDILEYYNAIEGRVLYQPKCFKAYQNKLQGDAGEALVEQVIHQCTNVTYLRNHEMKAPSQVEYDFIIISNRKVIIFEVKHYSGNYFYNNNEITRDLNDPLGFDRRNPMTQLKHAENIMRRWLKGNGFANYEIETYLIFSNASFCLHGLEELRHQGRVLLFTQLYQLPQIIGTDAMPQKTRQLQEALVSSYEKWTHQLSGYEREPFENVRGGLRCPKCRNWLESAAEYKKSKCSCVKCDTEFKKLDMIHANLIELYYAKGAPFTKCEAVRWCAHQGISTKTIYRACRQFFKSAGKNKGRVYYL